MTSHARNNALVAAALSLLIAGGSAIASDDPQSRDKAAHAGHDAGESDQPVGDTWITTKVKASLLADEDVAGLEIDVETVNGVVTLTGNVDSQAQVDEAKRIAAGIEGVTEVDASALTAGGGDGN